ncbi:hypothetical protein CYMTET_30822 [Cymbomonas tetramitiformis]|uniref:Uncharacterized protein n=1 Tax=Cymbomonas tetramitiformis TaxID=36881 RepID=A0AAE0KTI2_9CHLO|nr:hypothetical protein CYMTET_30822 [Cymbomonas tetramitiformis]
MTGDRVPMVTGAAGGHGQNSTAITDIPPTIASETSCPATGIRVPIVTRAAGGYGQISATASENSPTVTSEMSCPATGDRVPVVTGAAGGHGQISHSGHLRDSAIDRSGSVSAASAAAEPLAEAGSPGLALQSAKEFPELTSGHQDWNSVVQSQLRRSEALTAQVQSQLKTGSQSIRKLREQQRLRSKDLPAPEPNPPNSVSGVVSQRPSEGAALSASVSGALPKQPEKTALPDPPSSVPEVVSQQPSEKAALPKPSPKQKISSGDQWLSEEAVLFRTYASMGKDQKVRIARWEENHDQLWSDHSGESAGSQASPLVRLQLVVASKPERESLRRWFQKEPRTRNGNLSWQVAFVDQLLSLKEQVSPREYRRMLRRGALCHEEGIPCKHFAGVNFGRARKMEKEEYPAQRNQFAALSNLQVQELAPPPGFPMYPFPGSSSEESSGNDVSPSSHGSGSSSSDGISEGRSGGRRRPRRKGKGSGKRRQRGAKAANGGWTLLKDKALRDQAFECLSEERQQTIAMAVVRGEKVSWEQEGWEAMMDTQRSVLKGKNIPSIVDVVTPPSPEETELSCMVPHMTLVRRKPRRLQTDTQAERLAMELQATIELKAI